ncbi:MAG: hypothetical protein IT244_08740 [Bacteroidia bacterium]|nr:hypothetical protein [Bacteroidia bacterium]
MIQCFKYLIPVLCFIGQNCNAQVQEKRVFPVTDSIFLDSQPVALLSIHVFHHKKELEMGKDFILKSGFHSISITSPLKYDTLIVFYQSIPKWLLNEKQHQKPLYNTSGEIPKLNVELNPSVTDGGAIVTDGVLLRGLSFGNAQDLVLNSSLNLRMYGKVGKDIEIEGAVTDQEYPFQPEGTTTTLQDFDRIYMGVKMPHISVLLGDYAFNSSSNSRFMKYAKKNRGLQLVGNDTLKSGILKWDVAAALARGRFSRNEINGVEGLQGPYRLSGTRGEQFVIVVSGTEVVYLDGKKMERGLQSDYVIDYNIGEITFTSKHIINAFSRIIVEFQYSDRFYTRTVSGGNISIDRKKATYHLSVFNEQDARNQPIQQDLQAFDSSSGLSAREILQISGDASNLAVLPGARKISNFSVNEPNYILLDTGAGVFYRFVEQPDTHKTFYKVNFTYLGPGKGHYILTGTTSNGKVYKYVGSISGVPAGDYEPITPLQAPNRLSMAEAGVNFTPRKGTLIKSNLSVSSNDKNLFSGLNDKDNNGIAAHFSLSDRRSLGGRDSVQKWYLQTTCQLEQTSVFFTSVERYRDVEFGREWNRSLYNPENGSNTGNSGFVNGALEVGRGSQFAVYSSGGLLKSSGRSAYNFRSGFRTHIKGVYLEPSLVYNKGDIGGSTNLFLKKQLDLGYELKSNKLGLYAKNEQSEFENLLMEKLPISYGLRELGGTFTRTRNRHALNIGALQRVNQNVDGFALKDAVSVQNITTELSSRNKKGNVIKLGASYRNMELLDTLFKTLYRDEKHIAGRMEYQFSKLLKAFNGNMFYQSISGREQQRQFSYFEVPAGQGYYVWVDFNSNGIKEVNEFQETPFKDQAKYVRLLVPTGNCISAQGTEFNGNIFYLPQYFQTKKWGKIQNRITWNYTGKSTAGEWLNRLLPFVESTKNTWILSNNTFIRNLLEFESQNGKYLWQYNVQKRVSKLYFTNGFDFRNSLGQQLFFRGNISQNWQTRLQVERKNSKYNSEFVPGNNFDYILHSIEPYLAWQPSSRFRLGVFGKYQDYNDLLGEIARLNEAGIQWNKAVGKGGILELTTSILQANYFRNIGTVLAYDVLQGFSAGRNYRGTIDLRFNASKNIQMIIGYEGRKTGDVRFIHVGRAEARYLF